MKCELTILGCSSATPTADRNPSAQVLNCDDKLFLIDCGEGTQMQFRKYKIKFQRIDHIFISHLHGDHYLGLSGLLFTFHLLERKKPLHIYANHELKDIIALQLKASASTLNYPLVFHELTENKARKIYEDEKIEISCFPLLHRVPTHGFLFKEKPGERNIIKEKIEELKIPFANIAEIKKGEKYTAPDGTVYSNQVLTHPPPKPKSYAYCSDTGYFPSIIPYIKNAELLYHEATFMHNMKLTADAKQHSTTVQAANIAKDAGVQKLVIGHFSARYNELSELLEETKNVFPNTELAAEGGVYKF